MGLLSSVRHELSHVVLSVGQKLTGNTVMAVPKEAAIIVIDMARTQSQVTTYISGVNTYLALTNGVYGRALLKAATDPSGTIGFREALQDTATNEMEARLIVKLDKQFHTYPNARPAGPQSYA